MIEYRSFHNTDPPQLAELWNAGELGRGCVSGLSTDALEVVNFSQTYFDPRGLILACEGSTVVGFVHAGFGVNEKEKGLDCEVGVICALLVHPAFRRRGIGRELVRRAEIYLSQSGAKTIDAGAGPARDPFYVGLYGGVEPAGFLDSDPHAAPFFSALGYVPSVRFSICQREIAQQSPPMNFRLMSVRRKTQLAIVDGPLNCSWWWQARFGRLDLIRFALVSKGGNAPLASLTAVGLDFYVSKWQRRAVGLIDIRVADSERNKHYGEALVAEVCRRLRQELVTCVELHAVENDPEMTTLATDAGLKQIDAGTVFHKND